MANRLYEAAYNGGGGLPSAIGRRLTPVVKGILVACVVMYFLQAVFGRYVDDWFALQPGEFHRGYIWQLFTYMFLHGNLIHIFFNMLILVMIGPETERSMGSRHFAIMYVVSGVLGGLGWVLITQGDTPCVGASGAIFGIIGAFAAIHTHDYITVLILFIFPVTMQAWVLAGLLGLFELFFVVRNVQGTVAHGVHLAGGIEQLDLFKSCRQSTDKHHIT